MAENMKGWGIITCGVMFAVWSLVVVLLGAWVGDMVLGSIVKGAVAGITVSALLGILVVGIVLKYVKHMYWSK